MAVPDMARLIRTEPIGGLSDVVQRGDPKADGRSGEEAPDASVLSDRQRHAAPDAADYQDERERGQDRLKAGIHARAEGEQRDHMRGPRRTARRNNADQGPITP